MRKILFIIFLIAVFSFLYIYSGVNATESILKLEPVENKLYLHIDEERVLVDLYDTSYDYDLALFKDKYLVRGYSEIDDSYNLNIVNSHFGVWHDNELQYVMTVDKNDLIIREGQMKFVLNEVITKDNLSANNIKLSHIKNIEILEETIVLTYDVTSFSEQMLTIQVILDDKLKVIDIQQFK